MSPVLEHGNAVLLAWAGGLFAGEDRIRQFTPRRTHSDTLWRVAVPVK